MLQRWRDRYLAPITSVLVTMGALASTAAVLGMRIANDGQEPDGVNWWLGTWIVVGFAYGLAGCVLLTKRSGRSLAALFLTIAPAALLTAVSVQYAGYESASGRQPRLAALADASTWSWALGASVLVALVPWSLLPSGMRDRREVLVARISAVVATAVVGFGDIAKMHGVELVGAWAVGLIALAGVVVLTSAWWRQRRTQDDPLAGWLLCGSVVAWLAVVPNGIEIVNWTLAGHDVVWAVLLLATVPLLVVGSLIEVLRRSQARGEQVGPGFLEWMLLATSIVFLYTGVVAGIGGLVGGNGPTWLLVAVTGSIALAIEPLRLRIRRLVDRLIFGNRDDTLAVVQEVVDHVQAELGENLLPALVSSLRRGLHLDTVAIEVGDTDRGWQRVASIGPASALQTGVLLRHGDEIVGRLLVGTREGPSLRSRDRQLLEQLAGPLGLAVNSVRVAQDLRRSSMAVVSAREEERRRLRRDLHDGVGPTLTGVSLGLRTALRQLDRSKNSPSPQTVRVLVERLADEIDGCVEEIKRIVRDLRPTALDQFGLLGAVAEFTRNFDDELDLDVSLPSEPAELPAAVEVAVYRIVTEALTNVSRHAHADHCWLKIEAGRFVEVDVIDDGVGIDPGRPDGVGMTAMRERVSELGGSVQFVANGGRGTHLRVRLPAVLP